MTMGKQLSFYFDELETKRLAEVASRECRRPPDQARYILRLALGLDNSNKHETATGALTGTGGGFVEVNPSPLRPKQQAVCW